MSDDMARHQRVVLGKKAEGLMADEAFRAAMERVEAEIVGDWKTCDTVGAREKAHAKMEVLFDIARSLNAIVGDGEMAQAEQEREDKK